MTTSPFQQPVQAVNEAFVENFCENEALRFFAENR